VAIATRNVMNKWTVFLCMQKLRWLQIAYRVGLKGNLCTWGILHVVDFGVDSKGRSAQKGHTPQDHDDSQGDSRAGCSVWVDWLTDGEVALRGERYDSEHWRVGRPTTYTECDKLSYKTSYLKIPLQIYSRINDGISCSIAISTRVARFTVDQGRKYLFRTGLMTQIWRKFAQKTNRRAYDKANYYSTDSGIIPCMCHCWDWKLWCLKALEIASLKKNTLELKRWRPTTSRPTSTPAIGIDRGRVHGPDPHRWAFSIIISLERSLSITCVLLLTSSASILTLDAILLWGEKGKEKMRILSSGTESVQRLATGWTAERSEFESR
jgi:hypothetical protein